MRRAAPVECRPSAGCAKDACRAVPRLTGYSLGCGLRVPLTPSALVRYCTSDGVGVLVYWAVLIMYVERPGHELIEIVVTWATDKFVRQSLYCCTLLPSGVVWRVHQSGSRAQVTDNAGIFGGSDLGSFDCDLGVHICLGPRELLPIAHRAPYDLGFLTSLPRGARFAFAIRVASPTTSFRALARRCLRAGAQLLC